MLKKEMVLELEKKNSTERKHEEISICISDLLITLLVKLVLCSKKQDDLGFVISDQNIQTDKIDE